MDKIEDSRSFFSLCEHNTILSCLMTFTKKEKVEKNEIYMQVVFFPREEKKRSLVVGLFSRGPPPAHDSLQMKCHPGRQ